MLKPTWCLNDRLSGADRGLKEVVGKAAQMAATTENVLITGETGTGKEVFARAIHSMGPRKDQPFVKINCGAIPETLIEDELFGHIKGAYSGAYTDKPGRIELAEKGTLFLDEIGELKPELQTRLLQVVQEKRIERIGSTKATPVDFRLLSATNQDIETMLRTRRLREDLYYRIATFHIHIPPLRERKKDIPLLIDYLLGTYRDEFGRKEITMTQDALEKMLLYEWPGNIRELESVLKRAVSLLDRTKSVITEKDIVPLVVTDRSAEGNDPFEWVLDEVLRTGQGIKEIENRILRGLLSRFNGKVYEASRATGIPKDRFYRKVK
jgi:two-component system response regulator AtoC